MNGPPPPGEGGGVRVLHVLDHGPPRMSGYVQRTQAILREQERLGWQPLPLIGPKHDGRRGLEEWLAGRLWYRTPPSGAVWAQWPVGRQWAVVTALRERIVALARELRPQLIHAHSPALNGLAAIQAGRRLGLPVIYEIRAFWEDAAASHGTSRPGGVRYRLTRALEEQVVRRADGVVVICQGLRRDLLARGVRGVTVVPNGVDAPAFAPVQPPDPALRRELGLGSGPLLGFIGSFYRYEGLSLLLKALPEILRRHPQVSLLLVGGGPEEAALREEVAALGLQRQVILTGRVPHEAVGRYYDLVDILIYPRLPMRLTHLVTPLKPLEAMAAGRLLVASDVGGHRELVPEGVGVLFPAGEVGALAGAVCGLLEQRASWPQRRRLGRRHVLAERTWEGQVAAYIPLYQRLTGRRG